METAKKIPKWRCKKCVHYRGHCPLEDLDSCSFVKSKRKNKTV